MQDVQGERCAIWWSSGPVPRYMLSVEKQDDAWWYVLWMRNGAAHWGYAAFLYTDNEDALWCVSPRVGVVWGLGQIPGEPWYIAMEEVNLGDRQLFWRLFYKERIGRMLSILKVLEFYTPEEVGWERY
jgi:hypothetical protein